jgi:hypothetical protein
MYSIAKKPLISLREWANSYFDTNKEKSNWDLRPRMEENSYKSILDGKPVSSLQSIKGIDQ